ncbi:unnamed protein product [Brassica rapa subsp. trilocularis]
MIHMSDLPEDLIEEILSRVPAASLKRFRTTCKRWNALLKDQGFTEKHFRKAPKQSQVLFGFLGRLKICSLSVNGCPSIEVIDEIRLTDPVYIYKQFVISEVFHCDGLLLCTNQKKTGLVVCNPCTRQARWIKPGNRHKMSDTYTLGSYQDIKSNNISYKILRCDEYEDKARFEIYEFGCNSWRILDVTNDYNLTRFSDAVSWRGKTSKEYIWAWVCKLAFLRFSGPQNQIKSNVLKRDVFDLRLNQFFIPAVRELNSIYGFESYNDNAEVNVSSHAFFICLHQLCLHNKNVNNNGKQYESVTVSSIYFYSEIMVESKHLIRSWSDISAQVTPPTCAIDSQERISGPTRRSNKGGWTPEQDKLLMNGVWNYKGKNWKKIAECPKTDVQCQHRWVQCQHRWLKVLNPNLNKGPWRKEEDDLLSELVNVFI